jgi:hypothetical protein
VSFEPFWMLKNFLGTSLMSIAGISLSSQLDKRKIIDKTDRKGL